MHVNDFTDGLWHVATVGGCVWQNGNMVFYHSSSNCGQCLLGLTAGRRDSSCVGRTSVIGIGWRELDLLRRIGCFASKTTPSFRTLTGLSKTFICNIICNTSREKKERF